MRSGRERNGKTDDVSGVETKSGLRSGDESHRLPGYHLVLVGAGGGGGRGVVREGKKDGSGKGNGVRYKCLRPQSFR